VTRLSTAVAVLPITICLAQEASPDTPVAVFGTTVVRPFGLRGHIYFIPEGTRSLPDFSKLEPVGTIYTDSLNVEPRNFREGFPGVTTRFTWFAIDYHGRFYINEPGKYGFGLLSDDGAKLYIDGKVRIDNDGTHDPVAKIALVELSGGIHTIRVSYFQGPCALWRPWCLALRLSITVPPVVKWRIFSTEDYKPPSDPKDWKYGDPNDLVEPPDPNLNRRKLRDYKKKS
jgi:hypothetical protein